ncbi:MULTISPECIES: hypothetical protein [Lactococcus]|nr:hypothetical protein [Lactococcus lactis]MCT4405744.1 hypothetical protein [Lactococcus cremoris]MBS5601506.1 hypothetical protein [Lactococcus lactis]MCH5429794.1 hypothetical protein [Lactococcus lactis]MCT1181456.1 hypothetical protein [Lactococcus lactis]MDM7498850.1 hypothetical protein [Lactococcus lactis]
MDFIKTASKNRSTYPYDTVKPKQDEILARAIQPLYEGQEYINDFGEDEFLAPEWISELHRADDRTVYSNNKNANPEFRTKSKKESNNESKNKPKKKWNSSLSSSDNVDKGKFAEKSSVMPTSYETPEQKLINDSLEKLSDDEASFLVRVVQYGEATKLAKEHHVSNKTINTWKNNLINKIKNS